MIGMIRMCAAFSIVACTAIASSRDGGATEALRTQFAQNGPVQFNEPALEYYEACMNEAITNHDSLIEGNILRYDCSGGTAKKYFDYLGNSTEHPQRDRYGLWTIRNFPGGQCAQHTQNADQSPTSGYDCTIRMVAPR
jgi:hypothetical protein